MDLAQETAPAAPTSGQADYRRLSTSLADAGLLRRSRHYHARKIAANLLIWAAAWAAVVWVGSSWYGLFLALGFAFISVQTGFLAHDIGHGQISSSRPLNSWLGYLHANLLSGFSFGWWVQKHNRHHGHPNDEEHDPDSMISVLAFSEEQARAKSGLARFITRHQAYLFVPLLLLEGAHIVTAGARWLVTTRGRGHRVEALLVAAHFAIWILALSLIASPLHAVLFLAIQMSATGLYAGFVFAPNHKGMPMMGKGEHLDYVRRQVLTARNVRPNPITDYVYGGLNYQVEHHLFPTLARNRLRQARALVREFCLSNEIAYHEVGVVRAFREVFGELNRLGRAADKNAGPGPGPERAVLGGPGAAAASS